MSKYWKYFIYVIEHKKNVFIECMKEGLYIHAFTHDLSKFNPIEFKPYANYYYGNGDKPTFDYAWLHHQRKNKHHWDYWVKGSGKAIPMPDKYIKQMICDWNGMSRKFGDTAQEYYISNIEDINVHIDTRIKIELMLGLIDNELASKEITYKENCIINHISIEKELEKLKSKRKKG